MSDAQLALQENSKYEQQRVQNETQISLVRFLRDYINNPANQYQVIPSNVGLEDRVLSTAIDQYNAQLAERKRLLLTSSEENPAVVQLDANLAAMHLSVQTTVESVLRGLQITKKDLDRQASKFEGRISRAPEQEKEFMSISRQQEIKRRSTPCSSRSARRTHHAGCYCEQRTHHRGAAGGQVSGVAEEEAVLPGSLRAGVWAYPSAASTWRTC